MLHLELQRESEQELQALAILHNAAGLGANYQHHWKQWDRLRHTWQKITLPWEEDADDLAVHELATTHYHRIFGDPNDPVYQGEVQRLINYWDKRA